jgi:apolipoprotein N-acyltransferase
MYVWTCLKPLPSLSVFNFYEYKCAYIQPSWTALSIPEQFYAIQKELDHLAVHYEDLDYIFMPEGAYPHNLAAVADKLEAFDSLWVHKPLIILGAHRCGADTYNSAYCIRDGRIIHSYDKQHLVFFVERLPLIMRLLQHTTSAFMPEHGFFTYPDEQQQDEIGGFQLYICSELFFKFKHPGGKPIIFLCYDAWFSCDYLQKLVYYDVQLYSIQYQVPIIYIGHAGCAIFYP